MRGGTQLALALGVQPIVVGLTVVAYGTSVPELFLGIIAGYEGASSISFGNIIGSTISNTTYIIGACAILVPIVIRFMSIRLESIFMIYAVAFLALLAIDGSVSPIDGVLLIATFIVGVAYMLNHQRRVGCPSCVKEEYREALEDSEPVWASVGRLTIGIGMLALGAQLAVSSASNLALQAGISPFLIGLTIVTFGTCLPELTISIIAARRGETDLAIGNAVGSVTFTVLVVAGAASLFGGYAVPGNLFWIGLVPLVIFSAILIILIWRKVPISRKEGLLLICLYAAYFIIASSSS